MSIQNNINNSILDDGRVEEFAELLDCEALSYIDAIKSNEKLRQIRIEVELKILHISTCR